MKCLSFYTSYLGIPLTSVHSRACTYTPTLRLWLEENTPVIYIPKPASAPSHALLTSTQLSLVSPKLCITILVFISCPGICTHELFRLCSQALCLQSVSASLAGIVEGRQQGLTSKEGDSQRARLCLTGPPKILSFSRLPCSHLLLVAFCLVHEDSLPEWVRQHLPIAPASWDVVRGRSHEPELNTKPHLK